jgi:serine/threonine protein phosphatase PrpC
MTTDPNHGAGEPPGAPQAPVAAPPAASGARIELAALSHRGHVRPNNEDVYIVVQVERALRLLDSNLPPGTFHDVEAEIGYGLLVADGVGGMSAGEVASRLAVTTLIQLALETPDWVMLPGQTEGRLILDRMTERFRRIDEVLREEAASKPELAGMGTTMTAAVIVGRELLLGHVGDSRAYLCRGSQFDQLTRDHTTAQEVNDSGFIPTGDASTRRYRNFLTRALGGRGNLSHPDLHRMDLRDGDQLLLCTDGLSDAVEAAEIASILRSTAKASDACRALVDLALKYGGLDNVTVGIARCHSLPNPAAGTKS